MKAAIKEFIVDRPFSIVLSDTKRNIILNDFLLIHEINTKQILAAHHIIIPELRQLFFFHPRYMKEILASDPLAVNEVPLKIVIREIEPDKTSISFPDPVVNLDDYNVNNDMASELLTKIQLIACKVP
jgi:uncharacterized protein (DUF302 family)